MNTRALISVLLGFGLACVFQDAAAQNDDEPDLTFKVLASANHYAAAIACESFDATDGYVAALVPRGPPDDDNPNGVGTYAVIWRGDVGCQGGSGTITWNITIVVRRANDAYLVDVGQSSPAVDFQTDVPNIERVVGASGNTVTFDGRDTCPGERRIDVCEVRVRVTLRKQAAGSWSVVKTRTLNSK